MQLVLMVFLEKEQRNDITNASLDKNYPTLLKKNTKVRFEQTEFDFKGFRGHLLQFTRFK